MPPWPTTHCDHLQTIRPLYSSGDTLWLCLGDVPNKGNILSPPQASMLIHARYKKNQRSSCQNWRQHQNKVNGKQAKLSSLKAQNEKLRKLLDLKLFVDAITEAVTDSLKVISQPTSKCGSAENSTGYVSKHFLRKSLSSQLTLEQWVTKPQTGLLAL